MSKASNYIRKRALNKTEYRLTEQFRPELVLYGIGTILKRALLIPQSGQTQLSGMLSQRVPAGIPSKGKPFASS